MATIRTHNFSSLPSYVRPLFENTIQKLLFIYYLLLCSSLMHGPKKSRLFRQIWTGLLEIPSTMISCRWQTRTTCCITANMLQINKVDAQCDKLASELSWQRFASKVANIQLPHLHLTCPTCIWRLRWWWSCLSFVESFGIRKLESLRDHTFSRFSRTPTCDRQTDGQTDTRRQLIPALASVCAGTSHPKRGSIERNWWRSWKPDGRTGKRTSFWLETE